MRMAYHNNNLRVTPIFGSYYQIARSYILRYIYRMGQLAFCHDMSVRLEILFYESVWSY